MSRAPRVVVEIGCLVLSGVAPAEGRALAASLEAALMRQLGRAAAACEFGQSRHLAMLRGGAIAGNGGARLVGERAASRLVGRLL
jgi:hypothetical protein